MKFLKLLTVALVLCCGSVDVKAALVHSDTPDGLYLSLGMDMGFVGHQIVDDGTGPIHRGSAIKISDHFILGAIHTSKTGTDGLGSSYLSYTFGFGSDFDAPQNLYTADEVFFNPDFVGLGNGPDQVLFYFETPITGVPNVDIYRGEYADLIGQDSWFGGYGSTGNNLTGFTGIDGNKRGGMNQFNNFFAGTSDYISSTFYSKNHPRGKEMGILSGLNDSGGFNGLRLPDGTFQLVGVNALGSGNGYLGSSTSSLYDREWGDVIIASKSSSVPEPSSLFLFGMGSQFLMFFRNKRRIKN